jgi:hypothetical protein
MTLMNAARTRISTLDQIQRSKLLEVRWLVVPLEGPLEQREAPWSANWGEVQGLEQLLAQQRA